MAAHTRVGVAPLIPGVANFRDLGGLQTPHGRTRPGLLMRMEAPFELPQAGVEALAALRLKTAIDLREPVERLDSPVRLDRLAIDTRSMPVLAGRIDVNTAGGLPELYAAILARCGGRIAEVVRLLAEPSTLPAVVFCSAGKDRTGLVCALALSAIGVGDDAVAQDFARSADALSPGFRTQLEQRAERTGVTAQALAVKLGAPPGLIADVLADLCRDYGGAAGYLIQNGLDPAALARLRAHLTESPAST
jgi:protein-tyrosine phosphatase